MFTYKGVRSDEMHLRVENSLGFDSPARDVDLVSVPGRDGDLVMDNGRFESVVRSFACRLEAPDGGDVEAVIARIHDWLGTDVRYHDFTWAGDRDFVYRAMVEGSMASQRVLARYARSTINFRLHPVKYLVSSLNERQVASGANVVNPYHVAARPVIRVVGSGNVRINIGQQVLDLRNVDRGITVDCETQTVTSFNGEFTEFDKMFSPFPVLNPGNNSITFSGNFQVFVTPRLGALV